MGNGVNRFGYPERPETDWEGSEAARIRIEVAAAWTTVRMVSGLKGLSSGWHRRMM